MESDERRGLVVKFESLVREHALKREALRRYAIESPSNTEHIVFREDEIRTLDAKLADVRDALSEVE